MRLRFPRSLTLIALLGLLLVPLGLSANTPAAHAFDYSKLKPIQRRILSGFADLEVNPSSPLRAAAGTSSARAAGTSGPATNPCPANLGSNIRVNQDCQNIANSDLEGRSQAQNETAIAADPLNPSHVVALFNNYQRGDGDCIGAYSVDGGTTWQNTYLPTSFTYGTAFGGAPREYWQAHGDPSVAWDTKGNAYFSCQVFNRGTVASANTDSSSAVYVYRSTATLGASWNFPGRPVIEFYDATGTSGVLEDKPYMTIDNHVGSPFQDRIYVTYTEFAADGTAYIWESYSADYGETFSPRVLVSTNSSLCPFTYGLPTPQGSCNENQFSDPFVGPDGNLYVAFSNFNDAAAAGSAGGGDGGDNGGGGFASTKVIDNHYQILLTKSTDGGIKFGAPVLVGSYYDLPDCATYQNGQDDGRACVPEKGATANSFFRATNYASGAVNPTNAQQVVVTYGSYINQNSTTSNGCAPLGFSAVGNPIYNGVKTAGACNNDIIISVSIDGGATFTGTKNDVRKMPVVTSAAGQATTDQFWQWEAFTTNGHLVVSYYDRQYGTDEATGASDISVSTSSNLSSMQVQRVTSGSMPPPTQFSGLFFGDYSGLTAVTSALPLWMDTRIDELFLCTGTGVAGVPPALCTGTATNAPLANDQNAFTARVDVP
jgi:hypothetical protein